MLLESRVAHLKVLPIGRLRMDVDIVRAAMTAVVLFAPNNDSAIR